MDNFFESHVADLDETVTRLDVAGDADGFVRQLADLIENASSRITIPVQVVNGELVVRTEAGPFRVTVERAERFA
jgi:hypothetical protein